MMYLYMFVNPNRKISRSQMAGISLIKICWALISVRVPLETLPTKGKISISINNTNNSNNDSNNDNDNSNNNDNNDNDNEK